MSYALEFKNISYLENENVFLKTNLKIEKGKITQLIFQSELEKKAFTDLVLGNKKPDLGVLRIYGYKMSTQKNYIKHFLGYKYEKSDYMQKLSVSDYFKLSSSFYDGPYHLKALSLCKKYNIDEKKKLKDLNQNERELLAIIDAIYFNPELIILEEPYKYLDDDKIKLVRDELSYLKSLGKTIVLISSNYNSDAKYIYKLSNFKFEEGFKFVEGIKEKVKKND